MTCWGSDTGHLARENKQVRPSAVKQEQPQFHRPWSSQAASTTLISVRGTAQQGISNPCSSCTASMTMPRQQGEVLG